MHAASPAAAHATPPRPASACARRRRRARPRAGPARRPSRPRSRPGRGRPLPRRRGTLLRRRRSSLRRAAPRGARTAAGRRSRARQLAGGERGVVVAAERLVQRVVRVPLCSHISLGGRAMRRGRHARRLHQQREQAFGGAEVAAEQRRVGVHRSDEADAAEVVALGHHLRADQDVDLSRVDRAERRLERALAARAVGVDPGDARVGKQAASCSSSRSVPRPTGAMSRLPQSGQRRGTGSASRSGGSAASGPACGRRARRCSAGSRSASRSRRTAGPAHSRVG